MKRLLAFFLLSALSGFAATWYATSSSVNINAVGLWVPTQTGNCTGSGTALVFGAQATGDIFNANGCTAIAINVDPGGASVQVTLTNDVTNSGGFTYATTTNITMHANVTAGKSQTLAISGSSGGGTLSGNITGTPTANAVTVNDGHTVVTFNVVGNVSGGAGANARGFRFGAATGTATVTGNATGGSGTNAAGFYIDNGSNTNGATITGNCIGGTVIEAPGCDGSSTGGPIIVIGNIISSAVTMGAHGRIQFTPAAANYILMPKDASYATGVIDSHATEMPTDPGVANVRSGTAYGSFTGTMSATGSVTAIGNW